MKLEKLILKNWKGLTGSFEFKSPHSVFVGPNGSGKSAILEAIQVLFSGFTGLGKKASSTLAFASEKETEISGCFENGKIITRKFKVSGPGGASELSLDGEKIKDLPAEFSFPLEVVHPSEFLSLSGDKRAEFVFRNLGISLQLTAEQQGEFSGALLSIVKDEELTDFMGRMESRGKSLKEEITRFSAKIESLTGQSSNLPAGNVSEWEAKLQEIEKFLEVAVKENSGNEEKIKHAKSIEENRASLQKQHDLALDKIANTIKDIDRLEKEYEKAGMVKKEIPESSVVVIKALEDNRNSQNALVFSRDSLIKTLAALRSGVCPTCGAQGPDISEKIDSMDFQLCEIEEKIQGMAKELPELTRKRVLMEKFEMAQKILPSLKNEILVAKNALESYQKTGKKLSDMLEDSEKALAGIIPENNEVALGKIEGLKAQRVEAKEVIKKFIQFQAIKTEKIHAEEMRQQFTGNLEKIKDGIKKVKKYRDESLESAISRFKEPFQKAVSIAFPDYTLSFSVISSSGKPEIDFGIEKGGKARSFDTLSGGEKVVFLVALAAAIQSAKGNPSIGLFELAEMDHDRQKAFVEIINALGYEQTFSSSWSGNLAGKGISVFQMGGPC